MVRNRYRPSEQSETSTQEKSGSEGERRRAWSVEAFRHFHLFLLRCLSVAQRHALSTQFHFAHRICQPICLGRCEETCIVDGLFLFLLYLLRFIRWWTWQFNVSGSFFPAIRKYVVILFYLCILSDLRDLVFGGGLERDIICTVHVYSTLNRPGFVLYNEMEWNLKPLKRSGRTTRKKWPSHSIWVARSLE